MRPLSSWYISLQCFHIKALIRTIQISSPKALDFQFSKSPAPRLYISKFPNFPRSSPKAGYFQISTFPKVQPQGSRFPNFENSRGPAPRLQIYKFPIVQPLEIWKLGYLEPWGWTFGNLKILFFWKFGSGVFKTEQLWILGGEHLFVGWLVGLFVVCLFVHIYLSLSLYI